MPPQAEAGVSPFYPSQAWQLAGLEFEAAYKQECLLARVATDVLGGPKAATGVRVFRRFPDATAVSARFQVDAGRTRRFAIGHAG